jgi:hypothetical protein
MPYENMLIPMITLLREVPGRDFGQISSFQARLLTTWYWLAIFSRRYSSAAQSYVLEDAQALERAGRGNFAAAVQLLQKISPVLIDPDDLYTVNKKYDALYKGVLNFCSYATGGFLNLDSGSPVTSSSMLEDHHIFPKDYLKKNPKLLESAFDGQVLADCVANRTLIPKLTNVKVGNKPPSAYLTDLEQNNPMISKVLGSHLIPTDLLSGAYDDVYQIFLDDRASMIFDKIKSIVFEERAKLVTGFGQLTAA